MKRDNKMGPAVLGSLPNPARLTVDEASTLDASAVAVVDMRPWKEFQAAHIPGSLWTPMDNMFTTAAGSFIGEDEPIYLCVDPAGLDEAIRCLIRIGLDDIRGWFDKADLHKVLAARPAASRSATIPEIDTPGARADVDASKYFLLDVRNESEFGEGHLPGSFLAPYTRLADQIGDLPSNRRILVNCKSGGRSGRACSYLQRAGYNVTNLAGGYDAWSAAGAPTER